jgi:hypothetical protein
MTHPISEFIELFKGARGGVVVEAYVTSQQVAGSRHYEVIDFLLLLLLLQFT